jgi:hypothetical protein
MASRYRSRLKEADLERAGNSTRSGVARNAAIFGGGGAIRDAMSLRGIS